jgi:hypothetical protein
VRGGIDGLDSRKATCATAMKEPITMIQEVDELAYLGQNKGSVRLLWVLCVLVGRNSEQRWSRMVAFYSLSPQIQTRVFSFFLRVQSKGSRLDSLVS